MKTKQKFFLGVAVLLIAASFTMAGCELFGIEVNCEHVWDLGTVTTQPTATSSGVRTFTCILCGATKTETIPPDGGASGTLVDNAWLAANNWTIGIPFQTSTYTVSSVLTVPEERTLTIMPGTTISFTTTGSGITVQNGGTIKAEGLPILLNAQGENIGITSGRIILKNSVVGGKWGGILIHSPTPNELSYVDISKGGSGTYTYSSALYLRGCNVSISNSTIDDSGSNGITLYSNASLNLNTVSISNNARYGVYYESSSGPTLTHSGVTFSSNTLGNFWNGTTASDTLP